MKKTRNVFILKGNNADVQIALNELKFKGMSTLLSDNITDTDIFNVLDNNKSVLLKDQFIHVSELQPIFIRVFNGSSESCSTLNCIDISKDNIVEQFKKITERLELDVGDHISNSSGLKGAPSILDCYYCRYFYSKNNEDNVYKNRTIYESKNYFVIPTLGQFIKGYLLIIPKRHIMSMADVTQEEHLEFINVLNDIDYILRLTYQCPELLVWENGTGKGGLGKAKDSIVHAHVHIAPSILNVDFIKSYSGFSFTKIHYTDLYLYSNHSYLLIKGNGEYWYILSNPDVYIPRQYVRQLIAEEYGIKGEQWNWRLYPFHEMMFQTCKDISNAIRGNWNQVPKKIRDCTEKFFV